MILQFFLIILICLALGAGIYLFFYNKESQLLPQDKFSKDWESFIDQKPKIQSKWNISAFFLFLFTFGFAIIVNSIVFGLQAKEGHLNIGAVILALAFWPFFPYGLILIFEPLEEIGALLICVAYPASMLFSLFIKNKRYLTFVYLIFIFILILNIIGCSEVFPNDITNYLQSIE